MLARHPDDPDLLGLLGLALEAAGDVAEARQALERAVNLPAETRIRLRNASNLASLLAESGNRQAAAALLKQGWRWPLDRAPDPKERQCLCRLAELMERLGLHDEIVSLLAPVAALTEPDWQTLRLLVTAYAHKGDAAKAFRLLERHGPQDVVVHEREALRAHLCWRQSQPERAAEARRRYLASVPPVILPTRSGQRLRIGIIDNLPAYQKLIRPWPLTYFTENFPSQFVRELSDRYRVAGIFCGAGEAAVEQFKSWAPDVIINNVTNAERLLTGRRLAEAKDFTARLAPRVINPPDKAARCTRHMNPVTLTGIDGLVLPSVRRYRRELSRLGQLVTEIEGENAYPMIVRTPYQQQSQNMILVRARAELEDAIRALTSGQLYVIEYLGQPREHGCFRRMRSFFIGGQPIIIWVDYARTWIVRSRRYIDLQTYRDHPDLLQKANAIISKPHRELGEKAMAVLEAVGRKIPLDIFGMDFDVDDDGNVVFFEANATMRMMIPVPEPFAYPPEGNERLVAALDQLLHEFAERKG